MHVKPRARQSLSVVAAVASDSYNEYSDDVSVGLWPAWASLVNSKALSRNGKESENPVL